MEKIGIMTWFKHNNYGTVLQVYALQKVLTLFGNEVSVINYSTRIRKTMFHEMDFKYINSKISNKLLRSKYGANYNKASEKFAEFRQKHLNLTNTCDTHMELKSISDSFDKVVCGSDQVWNPNFFDKHYFLDFVSSNSKKISYAPSIGVDDIKNSDIKDKIKNYLNSFSSLSVREEQGKKVLEKICDKKIEVVLDPTLLLSKEEWKESFKLEENNSQYILCYFLGDNKRYVKAARELSKRLNLPLRIFPTTPLITKFKESEILFNCGPKEFVENLYNASFVLTDSFHGLAFSINFEKDFYALKRFSNNSTSQNSRIFNILNNLGLIDRIYEDNIDLSAIDYDKVSSVLEKEREKSINYLKNAISEKNSNCDSSIICNNCTGCGMCAAVCPKKCISIVKNDDGFYKFKVDKEKCINCNLCKKVCAQNQNNSVLIKDKQKMYSAITKTSETLLTSSSGGVAYELSLKAIEMGYPIIGCTYDYKNNRAEHIVINNKENIIKISGSKYLQSYTKNAFEVITNLDKAVIFGTPCQIASIDNYLRIVKKRDNFILIDLICHGVPSYLLWDKLISELNVETYDVRFRNKKYKHKKVLTINSKAISNDRFYTYYDSGLIYNECCYDCNYRERMSSDIRIGDFWGKKSENGISKVLINSSLGEQLFTSILGDLNYTEENVVDFYSNQQKKNVILPIERYTLLRELRTSDSNVSEISKKYCNKIIKDAKFRKKFYNVYRVIKKHR